MTETEALVAEGDLSPEEERELAAAVAEHEVDGRLAAVERECLTLLQERELPTGPCWYAGGFANEPWYALRAMGYAPDSREAYAAKMLADVRDVRRLREAGELNRALMHMFYLGVKWAASGIKERHGSKSRPKQPLRTRERDLAMAREFQRRRPHPRMSDTALMSEIGLEQEKPLKRSSSIEAIRRGLKILSG